MSVLNEIEHWFDVVLFWSLFALRGWALVDCLFRRSAAFPAADKLSKPAWLGILVLAELVGTVTGTLWAGFLFWMVSIIAALVYLADVRPALKEITGR
ncbi:MAG: DUF2516 family protein [Actinomycetia bacterium]|nr:DUF2516 family protein [Actinomycetes bacterium]